MRNLLLILLVLVTLKDARAQTILKDWKSNDPRTLSDSSALLEMVSSGRGLLIPRLTTVQRNAINNPKDGLLIYNTDEGCFDYYQLATTSWVTSCGTPIAAISINATQCGLITANGNYSAGVALTPANYLAIPVTVTAAGSYTITGTTTNGYFFSINGMFPSSGNYTINVPGSGTPSANGTDNVTLKINGVVNACVPKVQVGAVFTMNCSSITVNGNYIKNIALNSSNTLSVPVTVTNTGTYGIVTNAINGYSFSASGTFSSTGNQVVTLTGTGTPVTAETDRFTIIGSNAPAICTAPVTVVSAFRKINILSVGSFAPGPNNPGTTILTSATNFSPSGTYKKIQGVNLVNTGSSLSSQDLTDIGNGVYDMIIIGCCYAPSTTDITTLVNFVKSQKGVVLEFNQSSINLFNAIYGSNYQQNGGGAQPTMLATNINHPILNGVFGDIRGNTGKYLSSDDGLWENTITAVPANATALWGPYTGVTPNVYLAIVHNTLGYAWEADGGFMSNTNVVNANANGSPATPTSTINGQTVYNSFYFANALAWGFDYIIANKH